MRGPRKFCQRGSNFGDILGGGGGGGLRGERESKQIPL